MPALNLFRRSEVPRVTLRDRLRTATAKILPFARDKRKEADPGRRALVAGSLISAAVLPLPAIASRFGDGDGGPPDSELIDLKRQFDEALGEWRVAHAGYEEARKIYERMLPAEPPELRSWIMTNGLAGFGPPDSTGNKWSVAILRDRAEAWNWKAAGQPSLAAAAAEAERRIPIQEAYEADEEEARRVSNIWRWSHEKDRTGDLVCALAEQIKDAPARTLQGFAIKAAVLKDWLNPAIQRGASSEDIEEDTGWQVAAQLAGALIAFAGMEAAQDRARV